MQRKTLVPYAVFVVVSFLAGSVGSFFTIGNIMGWYHQLSQPSWTPPDWLFGPVWTTLYVLMGVAAGKVWNSGKKGKNWVIALFLVHLLVNAAWSVIFFGAHETVIALMVIKLLWVLIVAMMIVFWRYSRAATYLLIPYLLWVTYAATLNLGIVLLNP